jgi:hypothetical protein
VKIRNVFGVIFLVTGLGIFFVLAANSISAELHDVLHEAPAGGKFRQENAPKLVNKAMDSVLPATVADLPYIKKVNGGVSTMDSPIQQFNVVTWLGWAFVAAAVLDIATAYLTRNKVAVEEAGK